MPVKQKTTPYWVFLNVWIVDYLGLGGRDYIGIPKQPTLRLCMLEGDRYQKQRLQGGDRLQSATFPNLNLTAAQIFATGQ